MRVDENNLTDQLSSTAGRAADGADGVPMGA